MSFKRDGNDSNLLTSLRKRRIGELLGESIPEEEAKLLSNGRFTCTVCNSVPIFDNVNMLVVHRQGKKHLANLKIHESKQRELMQLKAKRDHHQFLKKGTTFLPMALSSTSGILKSTPYDSRVEKAKVHPTERKQRINLPENFNGASLPQNNQSQDNKSFPTYAPLPDAARLTSDISIDSKHSLASWEDIACQQLSGPVMHDHQLKQIFSKTRDRKEIVLSPYQRKRGPDPVASVFNTTTVELNQVLYSKSHDSYLSPPQFNHPVPSSSSSNTKHISGKIPNVDASCSVAKYPVSLSTPLPQQQASVQFLQPKASEKGTANSLRLQKLKQLQGSGWKKDWDGKWIKDENAEFDSDEEPPDIF